MVKLVVVGLGGNALSRRGEPDDPELLRQRLDAAAGAVGALMPRWRVVVTHGNGPQVGRLALDRPRTGLDVLDAATEGELGYLVELALRNCLPAREIVTVLTQVDVDPGDPAFATPTKPIGALYTDEDGVHRLADERGWSIARDGAGWRRVVASPRPQRIVEAAAIRTLVDAGAIVVCAGGGGIPTVAEPFDRRRGVDAVIDKDLTTATLAVELDADALLLLTDVDAVVAGFGEPDACRLRRVSASTLRSMSFAPGSMGPKVDAACSFVEATGRSAFIGCIDDATEIVEQRAGTSVVAALDATVYWR